MRVRRLRRLVSAFPLVFALVALGCVGAPRAGTDQEQPARPAEARAPRAATTTPAPSRGTNDGTDTIGEFRADMASAERLAEQYWKDAFAANGDEFQPVSEVIPYTRDGEVRCGDEPIERNNAAYCSAGDFIAYDVNWAYAAFKQVGDAFVYYLLGHEYAHAIQLRLRIRKEFTIQQELQADCLAGAYLGDMQRARKLTVTKGDLVEFRQGLGAVGDDPGQPWFAEGSHGTAEQRTRAFLDGYEESLEPCGLT